MCFLQVGAHELYEFGLQGDLHAVQDLGVILLVQFQIRNFCNSGLSRLSENLGATANRSFLIDISTISIIIGGFINSSISVLSRPVQTIIEGQTNISIRFLGFFIVGKRFKVLIGDYYFFYDLYLISN